MKTYRASIAFRDGSFQTTHETTATAMVDYLAKVPAQSLREIRLRRLDHGRHCANTITVADLTVDAAGESRS